MKSNILFYVVLAILIAIMIGECSRRGTRPEPDTELQATNDSLKSIIKQLNDSSIKAEQLHRAEVQSLLINYNNKLRAVTNKYDKAREEVVQLPVTEQVEMLSDFIWQTDSVPKILYTGSDTVIQLKPIHVSSINSAYLELEEYNEKYYICEANNDSLVGLIHQSYDILRLKDQQIETVKQYSYNQSVMIQDLNAAIKLNRKENRRKQFTVAGIGIGVGIITALILVK